MRRRAFLNILGSALAWPLTSRAQPGKVHLILWVSTEAQPDPFIAGFREGMRERGYVEGENLVFVLRYAPGDPAAVRAMLPELLTIPADLIVSSGPAIQAMRATLDRPVLFAVSGDPIALGIVQSLARPGRNFTGSTFLSLEVAQKRVQLLGELLPGLQRLAVLSYSNHPGEPSEHEVTKAAASALSIDVVYAPFAAGPEIERALERTSRRCRRCARPWHQRQVAARQSPVTWTAATCSARIARSQPWAGSCSSICRSGRPSTRSMPPCGGPEVCFSSISCSRP